METVENNLYTEGYYERGENSNYHGYKDDILYERLADFIVEKFDPDTFLDVGCAKGFLIKHLRDRGVDAYGVDISKYACDVSEVKRFIDNEDFINYRPRKNFDIVFSQDMLEHISEDRIDDYISRMFSCGYHQFHIITTSEHNCGGDNTHKTIKELNWWKNKFNKDDLIINKLADIINV